MRRPRAGLVSLHSGGSGTPLVRHYDRAARSFADGDGQDLPLPENAAPETEIAAMERRGAMRLSQRREPAGARKGKGGWTGW